SQLRRDDARLAALQRNDGNHSRFLSEVLRANAGQHSQALSVRRPLRRLRSLEDQLRRWFLRFEAGYTNLDLAGAQTIIIIAGRGDPHGQESPQIPPDAPRRAVGLSVADSDGPECHWAIAITGK